MEPSGETDNGLVKPSKHRTTQSFLDVLDYKSHFFINEFQLDYKLCESVSGIKLSRLFAIGLNREII